MFTHLSSLLLALLVLSACSSETREISRPANIDMEDLAIEEEIEHSTIESTELDELKPGTQEDLVANVGDRVFFEFNSAILNTEAQRTLQRQADWLVSNSNVNVTVEGHCDERGTREFNLALGERRATAVKNYLMSLGVNANRINVISYGKEHPEYIGHNEVAWSKNRRAVTVVTQN